MSTKINLLLQQWPPRTVGAMRWLKGKGVDSRLVDRYVRSGWLERIGCGAYKPKGWTVDWAGALHALQAQLGLALHVGGIAAAELRGHAHYLSFRPRPVLLFGKPGTRLPAWFVRQRWSRPQMLVATGAFGGNGDAVSALSVDGVEIGVATLEQAALEMMFLVPKRQSYEEALQTMESMALLRPAVVQRLLEGCKSVKAKRLFLHAAERLRHPWLQHVDTARVDLGVGRRTIHAGGRLDGKYDLVVADPFME